MPVRLVDGQRDRCGAAPRGRRRPRHRRRGEWASMSRSRSSAARAGISPSQLSTAPSSRSSARGKRPGAGGHGSGQPMIRSRRAAAMAMPRSAICCSSAASQAGSRPRSPSPRSTCTRSCSAWSYAPGAWRGRDRGRTPAGRGIAAGAAAPSRNSRSICGVSQATDRISRQGRLAAGERAVDLHQPPVAAAGGGGIPAGAEIDLRRPAGSPSRRCPRRRGAAGRRPRADIMRSMSGSRAWRRPRPGDQEGDRLQQVGLAGAVRAGQHHRPPVQFDLGPAVVAEIGQHQPRQPDDGPGGMPMASLGADWRRAGALDIRPPSDPHRHQHIERAGIADIADQGGRGGVGQRELRALAVDLLGDVEEIAGVEADLDAGAAIVRLRAPRWRCRFPGWWPRASACPPSATASPRATSRWRWWRRGRRLRRSSCGRLPSSCRCRSG